MIFHSQFKAYLCDLKKKQKQHQAKKFCMSQGFTWYRGGRSKGEGLRYRNLGSRGGEMSWRNEGMNEHTPYSLEPFTSGRTQSLPLQTSGVEKGIYLCSHFSICLPAASCAVMYAAVIKLFSLHPLWLLTGGMEGSTRGK